MAFVMSQKVFNFAGTNFPDQQNCGFEITPLQSHTNDFISSLNAGRNLENEGMLAV